MGEKIEIKSNPIQRNRRDVATELTKLYIESSKGVDFKIEEIQEAYIKFYATVSSVEMTEAGYSPNDKFKSIIPDIL